jgi:murein DD-endopeptidase MepM/ murein hydrolase activator NlpD
MDSSLISPLGQVPTDILTAPGSRLEEKVRAAQNSSGEKKSADLKKVAQEFEAIFIAQLLKVMRETIEESGLTDGGFGKSIYTELFDQEVSLNMARRGTLGIADLLYQNLSAAEKPAAGESAAPPATDPAPTPQTPSRASPESPGASTDPEPEIGDLQLPVRAPVSSAFGLRKDPFSHQTRFHKGVDLAAPEGTKVVAALPGTVVFAGYEKGYGNTVLLQHPGGLQTRYGHLASIDVRVGDAVTSQNVLGTVGNTGQSTGPHLHFEVIRMGRPVDPLLSVNSQIAFMDPRSGNP